MMFGLGQQCDYTKVCEINGSYKTKITEKRRVLVYEQADPG
ncbi:hypothetical protein AZ54_17530 [Xanthomonas oryzae pv. oryzae PXO86]|nr:hypothetical protein AZ54_17530 [Xanthomonas oryzae pv. oryzae PXO86]